MPGRPHPRHDGFKTHMKHLKQAVTQVAGQQTYPGIAVDTGAAQTITATAGFANLPTTRIKCSVLIGVSLQAIVTIGGVIGADTTSPLITEMLFSINGVTATSLNSTYPVQLVTNGTAMAVSVSGVFVVSKAAGDNLQPGTNVFEVQAQTSASGHGNIGGAYIWAVAA
jgi:hypothetical protein